MYTQTLEPDFQPLALVQIHSNTTQMISVLLGRYDEE